MPYSATQAPDLLLEDRAEATMSEFVEAVREQAALESWVRELDIEVGQPERDPGLDGDGRYGWRLPVDGVSLSIIMPGAEPTWPPSAGAHGPDVVVNGRRAGWHEAVFLVIPMPR